MSSKSCVHGGVVGPCCVVFCRCLRTLEFPAAATPAAWVGPGHDIEPWNIAQRMGSRSLPPRLDGAPANGGVLVVVQLRHFAAGVDPGLEFQLRFCWRSACVGQERPGCRLGQHCGGLPHQPGVDEPVEQAHQCTAVCITDGQLMQLPPGQQSGYGGLDVGRGGRQSQEVVELGVQLMSTQWGQAGLPGWSNACGAWLLSRSALVGRSSGAGGLAKRDPGHRCPAARLSTGRIRRSVGPPRLGRRQMKLKRDGRRTDVCWLLPLKVWLQCDCDRHRPATQTHRGHAQHLPRQRERSWLPTPAADGVRPPGWPRWH